MKKTKRRKKVAIPLARDDWRMIARCLRFAAIFGEMPLAQEYTPTLVVEDARRAMDLAHQISRKGVRK